MFLTRAHTFIDHDHGLRMFVRFLRAIVQISFGAPKARCMFDHGSYIFVLVVRHSKTIVHCDKRAKFGTQVANYIINKSGY